jgi:hypothetical protein
MALMGQPVGDPRPPTLPLDEAESAALRELLEQSGWPVPATPARQAATPVTDSNAVFA